MTARRWALFIVINILVSVAATLTTLTLWERWQAGPPTPTPSPPTPVASLPTLTRPPEPTLPPPTPTPVIYIVQPGDTPSTIAQAFGVATADLLTVNGLTEFDLIHPGDVLVIPLTPAVGEAATSIPSTATVAPPTPIPSPSPPPSPTPSGPIEVRIEKVLAPGELAGETVVIVNRGRLVNLEGWTLSSDGSASYTFPYLVLNTGVAINVHTGPGEDSLSDLYWGREAAAWQPGEVLRLRDREGELIATFPIPQE